MQKYIILDYETRSRAPLKKVGAHEYAVSPSTEILIAAWRVGTVETLRHAKTEVWAPKAGFAGGLSSLQGLLTKTTMPVVAHNAGFERAITEHVLGVKGLPIERWICTAAMAASHALPRDLEGACDALKLKVRKDPLGKKWIKRYSKPRRPTAKNPSHWFEDMKGMQAFVQYCVTDVAAETELFLTLPQLSESEKKVWALNQRINDRGVRVDRELVDSALKLAAEESVALVEEATDITGGVTPTQIEKFALFLEYEGCVLPDLKAKTVADALASGLARGRAKRLLEIRQSLSKTSTKKYQAFELRSRSDGRLRDLQLYHGASTGREAGMGVQPHNFPAVRLEHEQVPGMIEAVKTKDLEWVKMLYGDPMVLLSGLLRSVIQATPGMEMFCADENAIEARIVFWLAGCATGIDGFASGKDPYRAMAAAIFNCAYDAVTEAQRDIGKRAVLGLGFGMGADKFGATCRQYGNPVSEELAEKAVKIYRTRHIKVAQAWRDTERAAINATLHPGKAYKAARCSWKIEGKFLYATLPSGRRLAYYGPRVKYEPSRYGDELRPVLYHWSTNPITKKWEEAGTYGGKLFENLVQGTARDVMIYGQLKTEDAGFSPLMSIHDEVLAERPKNQGTLDGFENAMATLPPWAAGLPVRVKGWAGERYRK